MCVKPAARQRGWSTQCRTVVGTGLGDTVGLTEGLPLGLTLGIFVGLALGETEGLALGEDVGASVLSQHHMNSPPWCGQQSPVV